MRALHIAVVGATGLVGQQICALLEQGRLPVARLRAMASPKSVGQQIPWGGQSLVVEAATPTCFAGVDLVLFSAGSHISAQLAPAAAAAGAVVIDNSACFRGAPQVPLVVPEVNPHHLAGWRQRRLVSNPNCSTIQTVVALAPLHRAFSLQSLVLCSYQAVSGAGRQGLQALREPDAAGPFARPIAANCLPQVGRLDPCTGSSDEELKMMHETRQILDAPGLPIDVSCVRVPVEVGHSVAVHAQFARPFDLELARQLLRQAAGVLLCDANSSPPDYCTPLEAAGQDMTYVGRLRGGAAANSAAFFCVADNLRKGAATNAVQIAELLAPQL
jgi:aspartate-semialdehyde dehydrogenase